MFKTMMLKAKPGCHCKIRSRKMDRLGVKWCRDNRATILAWLQEGYDHASWLEKVKAGALAVRHWAPMTLGGILDEAIARAEAKCPT